MTTEPTKSAEGAARPDTRVNRATELLRELIEANESFVAHLGKKLAVNPTDLSAMTHLISSGPLGPTDLARRLGMSTAAVTTVVDRLEAVGHVERRPHPTDRRSVMIVPNPGSVHQALGVLMPMIGGLDSALDDFCADERAVITRYLESAVAIYRAQVPDP